MIRKFLKNRLAYTSDLNKLIEAINKKLKITVRGNGVRTTSGPNGMQVTINPVVSGRETYLAKTQEASQSDGQISVKLLDSDGAETGDAFDVYAFADKRTTGTGRTGSDMDEFAPHIFDEETVFIKKIGEDWYLDTHLIYFGKFL